MSVMSGDDVCPVCQTDRYLNPQMKLKVGPCYHKMCESCIERLFAFGPAPCPTCRQTLRKAAFSEQTFEDLSVEKEVRIRKQMSSKFNKRREDFKSLKDYNDYLETVEDLTFKLVNEIDVETTKLAIDRFVAENRDLIRINADRLLNETRMATYRAEMERKEKAQRGEAHRKELEEEEAAKKEDRKRLIEELATSDKSAKTILAARQAISLKKTSMRKTEVRTSTTSTSLGASNGTPHLLSDTYWQMQRDEELDRQHEEDEDMGDFDPVQSQYMDVDLGLGYVNSVNNNKAHAGGLQYPLLSSSIGVKDLYVEPNGIVNLNLSAKAGGYRLAFGYERAIQDAHTALYTAAMFVQTQQQQQQTERAEPELDYRHAMYRPLSTSVQCSHSSPHPSGHADKAQPSSTLVNMSVPRSIPATTAVRMLKTSIKILMYMRGQMGSTWEQLEQQFIENGERIFVDLEGAIHSCLLTNLRSGIDAPSLYLSLAVIFGSTITTPKEQYMIRIGPLEPQEPLSTHTQTSSLSVIPTSQPAPINHADTEECLNTEMDVPGKRKREHQHDHEQDLERSSKESREQQHSLRLKEQRLRRQEEMQWERKLFQDIMGLSLVDDDDQPSSTLQSEIASADSAQADSIAHSPVLASRTKVHVLMKAPRGRTFDGLFPKQMLLLKEDYSIDTIDERPLPTLETTAAAAAAAAAEAMRKKRKARWPIHHLHILGPRTSVKEPSTSLPSLIEASPPSSTPPIQNFLNLDDPEDEIWYQIGSDIPVLSSLL
ncbi:TFIIH/NER complex subunit [Mortierella alpina]|nr:TFIIH/NER complex subunit [Mortierella alpina]